MSYLNPSHAPASRGGRATASRSTLRRVHDDRAGALQVLHGREEHGIDLGIDACPARRPARRMPMRAPRRPSRTSDRGVVRDRPPMARGGCRIVRILADDDLEDRDGVRDRARHRPGDVGEQAERDHAGPARQPHRRIGCRRARRATKGPRIELPVSLPRPTAPKFAAIAAAVPPLDPAVTRSSAYGFLRVARQDRVHGFVGTERPLRHVRLREHDGACRLHAPHEERVPVRDESLPARAIRRRSAGRSSRSCPSRSSGCSAAGP